MEPRTLLQKQAIENARSAFSHLPNGEVVFRQCISQENTIAEIVKTIAEKYQSHRSKRSFRLLQRFQQSTLWPQNFSRVVNVAVQTHTEWVVLSGHR